jgi:mRNA-degrading endonuclease toxin of MazEF toxin-antitoxin module
MLQRGVAYEIEIAGRTQPPLAVVLTKNSWNSRMLSVGAVPITPRSETTSHLALPLDDEPDQVLDPTGLLVVPREKCGRPVKELDDPSLHRLERGLSDLIDAGRLLADPPRGTRPLPGAIDYPRFGEIYYRKGDRIGGEAKRYVVVSNDLWNQRKITVLVARTTTQPKHPTDEFPIVQDGTAQVVCGELGAVPASALDLERRPQGQKRLGLLEMAAVAKGVTHTHLLRDHLDEIEAELGSIEA